MNKKVNKILKDIFYQENSISNNLKKVYKEDLAFDRIKKVIIRASLIKRIYIFFDNELRLEKINKSD